MFSPVVDDLHINFPLLHLKRDIKSKDCAPSSKRASDDARNFSYLCLKSLSSFLF